MNSFDWLMEWYAQQCNGDWEHSYGIRIETLDNPGWRLTVSLTDTEWAGRTQPWVLTDRTDTDWLGCRSDGDAFDAAGGPGNLGEMIESFRRFVDRA